MSSRIKAVNKLVVNILVLLFLTVVFLNGIMLLHKFSNTSSIALRSPINILFGAVVVFAAFSVIDYILQICSLLNVLRRKGNISGGRL